MLCLPAVGFICSINNIKTNAQPLNTLLALIVTFAGAKLKVVLSIFNKFTVNKKDGN